MVIFAFELRKQSKSKNDILKLQFQCQKIKRSAISDSHCLVTNNTNLKDLTAIFKKTSIIFIVFLQIFVKSDFTMITFVQPLRACILGPPASGKTLVIKQLCDHYKLHHIRIQDVIDEAVENLVSLS